MQHVSMGGQPAGSLELLRDPYEAFFADAHHFAADAFARERNENVDVELPHFERGIWVARYGAKGGTYHRHEMPVIDEADLPDLRKALAAHGVTSIYEGKIHPVHVKPTQCQIYVDKAVSGTAKFGVAGTREFLAENHLVTAQDKILDGHHRWLTSCTIDPEMELPAFAIGAPLEDLLPWLLEFSDERHERNL